MSSDSAPPPRRAVSRRQALRMGLMGVPALAGLTALTPAWGAPERPSGWGHVRYEDLYQPGDDLQMVANRVTGNQILTLPPGTFTVRDFRQGYFDGVRLGVGGATGCRGIVGSGPSTVIFVEPDTSTRDRGDGFAGNQLALGGVTGGVLSNFTLKGHSQNDRIYSGIVVNDSPGAELSWLILKGASRGYANHPPGETFGINVLNSPRVTISDTEVDGRNDFGTPVGASPIGWNNTTDAFLYRTYCHDGKAGMLTFYEVTNVYTEDYRCFATASGRGELSGHGINHEQSQGTITHIRPSLFIHGAYSRAVGATESTGMHVNLANTRTDVPHVFIVEPTWDPGPGSTGMFAVNISDGYEVAGERNKITTPPRITKNGVLLRRSDHPHQGFGDKDPAHFFSWIH